MVDIAASLSLTPSSLTLDPSAILGAEMADIRAFGDLLTGQVKAAAGGGAAAALPTLPTAVAGNRQESGKILPGTAAILPGMVNAPAAPVLTAIPLPTVAAAPVEAISVQSILNAPVQAAPSRTPAAPVVAAKPALMTSVRLVAPLALEGEVVVPEVATAEPTAQPAQANPVHALLKMVAAAIRTPRQTDEATAVPADQDAAPEGDNAEPSAPSAAATWTVAASVLPVQVLPALQSAAPAAPAPTAPQPQAAATQPFVTAAAIRAAVPQPAGKSSVGQTAHADPLAAALPQPAAPDQGQPAHIQPAAANPAPHAAAAARTDVPSVPVLTVAAVPTEAIKAAAAPLAAVRLTPAPVHSAAPVATARIEVTVAEPTEKQLQASDRAIAAVAATPAAERAAILDRILPTPTPIVADASAQGAAPAPAAPVATAPTVEMPRQDFAALVDRLVEARNAAAPVSTHASVQHAEFGQVSLHFQQDGNDLKVGMSSADPGFTAAVQAAMPAQNQSLNADTQQRGQSQQPNQAASTFAQSNNEAAGQRSSDAAGNQGGEQAGHRQGRGSRGGNDGSNPSQRRTGTDQLQTRGGVFA